MIIIPHSFEYYLDTIIIKNYIRAKLHIISDILIKFAPIVEIDQGVHTGEAMQNHHYLILG